jgi:hypothetical protein
LPTAELRETQIQQGHGDSVFVLFESLQRLNTVFGAENSVSLALEKTPHGIQLRPLVVDEKNRLPTAYALWRSVV